MTTKAKAMTMTDMVEELSNILVQFMTANTINAMRVLHAENKKAYSERELEWLSRVIDEEELCSGEDEAVDDEPHSWADVAQEILCPDCYENFVKKYGTSHITRAQLEEAIGHPLGDSPDLRVPNLKKN